MSEESHAAAVKAALTALNAVPYDLDDVPAVMPAYYNEVTISRRFGGLIRGESPTTTLIRLNIRAVAKTVSNAREMRRRAEQIEGTTVTVDGIQSTPIQFETAETIGFDDGFWQGLTSYTYAV